MKKLFYFLAIILTISAASSCTKKAKKYTITGDYFLFARTGTFDLPNGPNYYLVNNGELRKDVSQSYPLGGNGLTAFNFNYKCSPQEYAGVNDLPYSIPAQLFGRQKPTASYLSFMGGTFLDMRASINGTQYTWFIDYANDTADATIRDFLKRCVAAFP
jgi:hypothetical protein